MTNSCTKCPFEPFHNRFCVYCGKPLIKRIANPVAWIIITISIIIASIFGYVKNEDYNLSTMIVSVTICTILAAKETRYLILTRNRYKYTKKPGKIKWHN